MTKKLIATIAIFAVLGVFVAGCSGGAGGSNAATKPAQAPSGKSKVDAAGAQGQGGGVVPDLEIDR